MREYFDHAFESVVSTLRPLVNTMVEITMIIFVYTSIPLWIVPYMIYRKKRGEKK